MNYLISLVAVVSLSFGSLANAEIFYCAAENQAGIDWVKSAPIAFKPGRFKLDVDFEKNTIHAPDASLHNRPDFGTVCSKKTFATDGSAYIHCSSKLGTALMFNVVSYAFSHAMYLEGQDMYVAYGSCEPF